MSRRSAGVPLVPTTAEPGHSPGLVAVEGGDRVDPSQVVTEQEVTCCLDQLSPVARRLVEVGAVFGAKFTVSDLAEVMDQSAGGLLAAVQETVDAGVLIAATEMVEFRHDEFRRVAYRNVPVAVRLALHRQIGELLLRRREWAPAAHHLMQAVTGGDRVAAANLEQVAQAIRASSPDRASELALRALALTDPGAPERPARAATAVETLLAAGRLDKARCLGRQALGAHRVPPSVAAGLRIALAEIELFAGRPLAAIDEIRPVVSDPAVPAPVHALAEVWQLWAMLAVDDQAEVRRQLQQMLSGGAGRDECLPAALTAVAMLTWRDGRAADAVAMGRAAVAQDDRRQAGGTITRLSRLCLAWMLTTLGELEEAVELIDVTDDVTATSGHTAWSAAQAVELARVHLAAGRLGDARAWAQRAVDLATDLGTGWFLPTARAVLAELAVIRGELDDAASHLERPRSDVAWPPWSAGLDRWATARLTEARHGPDGLLGQATDLYEDAAMDARLLLDDPEGAAWLVRTALAAGDRERALRVTEHAEQLSLANASLPAIVAAARHSRGLAEDDAAMLQEASELYAHARARATASEDAGVHLLGTDRATARDLLERAVADWERQAAERDAARVRARLREIGVNRRRSRCIDRPVSGWASLTDSERAIAELVAEGLTNARVAERVYLSRHTVDFHLRQIFQKLGIDSRVTLARMHLERVRRSNAQDYAAV